jgi:hypothetical protein
MLHVGSQAQRGDGQVSGFIHASSAVVLCYGLELDPEHGPCNPVELRWLRNIHGRSGVDGHNTRFLSYLTFRLQNVIFFVSSVHLSCFF